MTELIAFTPALLVAATSQQRAGRNTEALRLARAALRRDPTAAGAWLVAGAAQFALERHDQALTALRRAVLLSPGTLVETLCLADSLARAGDVAAAARQFTAVLAIDPNCVPGLYNLALVLHGCGLRAEIIGLLRRAVAIDPGHESARHLLDAVTGSDSPSPPEGYVADLFDDYADRFESHLTEDLGYTVPDDLARLVACHAPGNRRFKWAVDLGCGSGLCGEAFRPSAARLSGVDLSQRMAEKAFAKQCYDDVVVGNAATYLAPIEGKVDLCVAADMLIYVGAVARLFAGVSRALSVGGLFAFSVEASLARGVELMPSGRYAHGDGYIRAAAWAADLEPLSQVECTLRTEAGNPIRGMLYLCRKVAQPSAWSAAVLRRAEADHDSGRGLRRLTADRNRTGRSR